MRAGIGEGGPLSAGAMAKSVKDSGQVVEGDDEYGDGETPTRPRRISRSLRAADTGIGGSLGSFSMFGGSNPLEAAAMGSSKRAGDDEEALRWAALEKLPTYDRVRTSILRKDTGSLREVDVQKDLSMDDIHHLLHKLHRATGEEDEQLLVKLRKRLDRYNECMRVCIMKTCAITIWRSDG